MKDKFFRILSPITLAVVGVLDAAVIYFAVFSVKKLISRVNAYSIFFAVMVAFALVIAVLVTKNSLTQGVIFRENELEFNAIDENNVFAYADITEIETRRDDKASLIKNFNDRHSIIIFKLRDETEAVIDIGLTTKKTLQALTDEIKSRI